MNSPIFIFSAGWRSGSTLVQRMLTATKECLIWGEPGGALNSFSDAMEGYLQMLGPGKNLYKFGFGGNGAEQYAKFKENPENGADAWIASMNPPERVLRNQFREFLENYYGDNARLLGFSRWGIKEVQSGLDTAQFLRSLFPEAKFIFLIRNPFDCLLSIKRRNWMDERNPRRAVIRYAKHWAALAEEFNSAEFGQIVRYEDILENPDELLKLKDYLELSSLDINFPKNSRADWRAENNTELNMIEKGVISFVAKDGIKYFRY